MCYPCTNCGRCGKFDPNSPLYTPPPSIPCLKCGGMVNPQTGICDDCGDQAFTPTGGMMASANSLRPDAKGTDPSASSDDVKGTDPCVSNQDEDSTTVISTEGPKARSGEISVFDAKGTDPCVSIQDEDPEEGIAS